MKKILSVISVFVLLSGCSSISSIRGPQVIEHEATHGPTYELKEGDNSIRYFGSDCVYPKESLEVLAESMRKGLFTWLEFEDIQYRKDVLDSICIAVILKAIEKESGQK